MRGFSTIARAVALTALAALASARDELAGGVPDACFCDFDCGGLRPARPGRCVQPEMVYDSRDAGWLLYPTRLEEPLATGDDKAPEWMELIAGDMSWEAWFRVTAPKGEPSTLMGTYGANHDGIIYSNTVTRRRYANVWIDSRGALSLGTNAGESSGITSPTAPETVSDGRWHHVAAVWSRSSGGTRVQVDLQMTNINLGLAEVTLGVLPAFKDYIMQTLANVALANYPDDIYVTIEDGQEQWVDEDTKFIKVYVMINTLPVLAEPMAAQLLVSAPEAVQLDVTSVPGIAYVLEGPVTVSRLDRPRVVTEGVGAAHLFVDGRPGSGHVTFVPKKDNVALDGEFTFCGGLLGRTFPCEIYRLRLWSLALSQSQVERIVAAPCKPLSVKGLTGGAPPHGLTASYCNPEDILGNAMASAFKPLEIIGNGQVRRGAGMCGYDRCPRASSDGCPLKRQVNFDSPEKCQDFATWNFCKAANGNRWRPHPFDGCFAGTR